MNAFSGVGARLSAALLVVLLGAFGIAYAIVVPSFERALVNGKVAGLERNARVVSGDVGATTEQGWQQIVDDYSAEFGARVVVFTYSEGLVTDVVDSNRGRASDMANESIAVRAATTGRAAHGTVERRGQEYAEAAVPVIPLGAVVLLAAPLHDTLSTVQLARRRLLVAAAIVFCFALLLGYGGARVFAGRLRRLERAADRIASGDFEQPLTDAGADEIGQLARAFERMRLRLAQLDRARSEFIGNASHELRTPLFSLGGFLELLDDEDLDEETRRDFVQQMREQVDRLTKLATDLLDLSRLDAGRMTVRREPVDLALVATTIASEFAAGSSKRRHVLVVEESEAMAHGDEQRVLQIARILVDNAFRHTPAGTTVRVRTSTSGTSARLEVTDDGPGIPAESAGQVFERFHRLEGAVAAGSGLGLAIARELAELMDGRIELESQPGRTSFALVLAAAQTREAEPAAV